MMAYYGVVHCLYEHSDCFNHGLREFLTIEWFAHSVVFTDGLECLLGTEVACYFCG